MRGLTKMSSHSFTYRLITGSETYTNVNKIFIFPSWWIEYVVFPRHLRAECPSTVEQNRNVTFRKKPTSERKTSKLSNMWCVCVCVCVCVWQDDKSVCDHSEFFVLMWEHRGAVREERHLLLGGIFGLIHSNASNCGTERASERERESRTNIWERDTHTHTRRLLQFRSRQRKRERESVCEKEREEEGEWSTHFLHMRVCFWTFRYTRVCLSCTESRKINEMNGGNLQETSECTNRTVNNTKMKRHRQKATWTQRFLLCFLSDVNDDVGSLSSDVN